MISTKDLLVEIEHVNNISSAVMDPADWSIVSVSDEPYENKRLSNNLYNTTVSEHVCLVLNRNPRKKRIKAMTGIEQFVEQWQYLETVSISYQKPNSGSNNGFLPLAEPGNLLYKHTLPNTKSTAWFQEESGHTNATNLWDLNTQPNEGDHLYYQRFSWELQLLMMSLCGVLECRKFIYAVDVSSDEVKGIHTFCKKYNLRCKIYLTDSVEYRKIQSILPSLG